MAHKAPRTKAHQVRFTEADWERVVELATALGMTPTNYVNHATGLHVRLTDNGRWEGLLEHGGSREGSGRKRKVREPLNNGG